MSKNMVVPNLPNDVYYDKSGQKSYCVNRQIPEILKLNCNNKTPNSQYIDSREIQPIVSTKSLCRIKLPKVGFMNNTAKLLVGISWGNSTPSDRYFLPPTIGINSIVKKISFMAGGTELFFLNSFDEFKAFEIIFQNTELLNKVGSVLHGTIGGYRNGISDAYIDAGNWNMQNKLEYDTEYETSLSHKKVFFNESLLLFNGKEFTIDFSQLVPILSNTPLPLYLIKDDIYINIEWNQNVYITGFGMTNETIPLSVDPSKVSFLADFVLYDQKVMDELAQEYKHFALPPAREYNLFTKTLTNTGNTIKSDLSLGGANRFIIGVVIMVQEVGLTSTQEYNSLQNRYRSKAVKENNENEFRIKINGEELFNTPLTNTAEIAYHLTNYNNNVPCINRSEYMEGVNLLSDLQHEKHVLSDGTAGSYGNKQYYYFMIDRATNKNGVQLLFNRNKNAVETGGDLLLKAYVIVAKSINCVDGHFYQAYS